MTKKRLLLLIVVAMSLTASAAFGQLKKVRLAIPTVDIVTLPLKMTQAKGFYKKEGLEVEIISPDKDVTILALGRQDDLHKW